MILNAHPQKLLVPMLFCFAFQVSAQSQSTKPPVLAQKIVDDAHAKHPEASEIGIAVVGLHACSTIASTDKRDIGEKCEKDDAEPMQTGKPFVEKGKNSFDVSLPLHDASGKIVGSVGIEIIPKTGQAEKDVIQQAEKIASEMEQGIPSKASLTQPF
jgi:hypothetical protein